MTDRPSIQQQVDEVQGCLLSIRSAVEAYDRAPQKERDRDTRLQGVITGCSRSKIEPLAAAVRSLEWLRDNEDVVREVVAARRAGE